MQQSLNLTIGKMQSSDIPEVVELEKISYGVHHWSEDSFYGEIKNDLANYYCAKDENGKIIGYVGFWIIFEEAHITTLSINPAYRRKKIAQILLTEAIERCYEKKVKFITLEVRVSNIAAISLYEKFGFQSVGTRKGYYQDNNEDALIMFTDNIWYSQFKSIYDKIKTDIGEVAVSYDETYTRGNAKS